MRLGRLELLRGRSAEVKALGVAHAEFAQNVERGFVFDRLRDRGLTETVGHLDDCANGEAVDRARGQVAHELAVDLERVERKMLEMVKRREPRAEVIEHARGAKRG